MAAEALLERVNLWAWDQGHGSVRFSACRDPGPNDGQMTARTAGATGYGATHRLALQDLAGALKRDGFPG